MAKTSPTSRTLAFLRAAGYTCAITEKWNSHAKLRQDLFGFIDVVGMHPDSQGLLGVQATSGSNHSARRKKILDLPVAKLWLETGNRIWVLSWSRVGGKWTPRIENLCLGDFAES